MTSIDRTAYPRLLRSPSARELAEAFTPGFEELVWAGEQRVRSQEHMLALVVLLKVLQRVGYFPEPDRIPEAVVAHVRRCLGLPEATVFGYASERTLRHHKALIRERAGISADQARVRKLAHEAITVAADVKDDPADLINVALERLVKARFELPAFSTLDRIAGHVRSQVNTAVQEQVWARMPAGDREAMLGLLVVVPPERRSGFDELKQSAPKPTLTKFKGHLDRLAALDARGDTGAWLAGVPVAKIAHFAGQARVLTASEMADVGEGQAGRAGGVPAAPGQGAGPG